MVDRLSDDAFEEVNSWAQGIDEGDKEEILYGCRSSFYCPRCNLRYVCTDNTKQQGTFSVGDDGKPIKYIMGPCACGHWCKYCEYGKPKPFDYSQLYMSPQAIEDIKKWGEEENQDGFKN